MKKSLSSKRAEKMDTVFTILALLGFTLIGLNIALTLIGVVLFLPLIASYALQGKLQELLPGH